MQSNILINAIAYNKEEKERDKTIDLLAKIHSGKCNKITSKIQKMTSKKTTQQINAQYATFDLLCN